MKQENGNQIINNNDDDILTTIHLRKGHVEIFILAVLVLLFFGFYVGLHADITTGISYTFPISFRTDEDVSAINIQKNFDFVSDQLKTINANFARLDSTRNR